ncbi:hypothetical protein ITP53_06260 [Nonomuraea sp. K274]|uniref:Uncharacterized protein n=1 Tax=Nonomuraea cypriaca TaxID=1187855 RepID=A0A931EYL7_9ACTN|nr:hypothetical protein [Nonomuraea cypriaca]MBF8185346.1 hypothetical protein [Nonomuraea cypriaca]
MAITMLRQAVVVDGDLIREAAGPDVPDPARRATCPTNGNRQRHVAWLNGERQTVWLDDGPAV